MKIKRFQCVGFIWMDQRPPFTDPEDYLDYVNRTWSGDEAERELKRGVLPPGMLVKAVTGQRIGVVVGPYNYPQEIVLLSSLEKQD